MVTSLILNWNAPPHKCPNCSSWRPGREIVIIVLAELLSYCLLPMRSGREVWSKVLIAAATNTNTSKGSKKMLAFPVSCSVLCALCWAQCLCWLTTSHHSASAGHRTAVCYTGQLYRQVEVILINLVYTTHTNTATHPRGSNPVPTEFSRISVIFLHKSREVGYYLQYLLLGVFLCFY